VSKQALDSLLDVTPIVLANLVVCYVMTDQNAEGEQIIVRIDKAEEQALLRGEQQPLHQCIIDLVVGTLYCSRRTFEFGIARTIKSFQPVEKKLNPGTWFYAKRNFVYLCECLAKLTVALKDEIQQQVFRFLDSVDENGKDMVAENGDVAFGEIMGGEYTGADKAREKKGGATPGALPSDTGAKGGKDRATSASKGKGEDAAAAAAAAAKRAPLTVRDEARMIKKMLLQLWDAA
jgi:hypothetical protein